MRVLPILIAAAALLAPGVAAADCAAKFQSANTTIDLNPRAGEVEGRIRDSLQLVVENAGDAECRLQVVVSAEPVLGAARALAYEIAGPSGIVTLSDSVAHARSGRPSSALVVQPGGDGRVDYQIQTQVDWDTAPGVYEQLVRFGISDGEGRVFDEREVQLRTVVPSASRLDFVGAVNRLDIGVVSMDQATRSAPFGIRVFSNSGYILSLMSENGGRMIHDNGVDAMDYDLTVSNRPVSLSGAGDDLRFEDRPPSIGATLPIVVTVQPDPTRRAGNYRDLVSLSVTPL